MKMLWKTKYTYPCRFKTHQAAGSCSHTSTTMRNSNDSIGIRTRLYKSAMKKQVTKNKLGEKQWVEFKHKA